MSRLNVDTISGIGGTFVTLINGATGDASRLTFPPTTIAFSPDILSTNAEIDTNIVFTFNQNIQFFGSGDIEIRQGSASGSLIESFTTGTSSRLSISANTLTIDPTSNLTHETTYYVILPPVGIANTFNALYSGSESYNFTTKVNEYTVTGAQHSFSRLDPTSPTGYYKYHVFTGTTPFSVNKPAAEAVDLSWMLIGGGASGGSGYSPSTAGGGGGGAGGVKNGTGPTLNLPGPANYIFTQGAGGTHPPSTNPGPTQDGSGSTITTPGGSVKESVLGGGGGGGYPHNSSTFVYGRPGASGGGAGGGPWPTDGPQIHPQWPERGWQPQVPAGSGTSGQGNSGGRAGTGYCPNLSSPRWYSGGGGGGAGGNGGNATYPTRYQGPQWPSYSSSPQYPGWAGFGGNGGPGKPVPAFSGPNLLGMLPIPVFPLDFLLNTHGNGVGPTGHYGGGGGGGSTSNPYLSNGGNGGSGGGGYGAYVRTPGQYVPTPFLPNYPVPSPSPNQSRPGYQYSGGGGGGGQSPGSPPQIGNGGSGCFMIRHATPEALS